MKVFSVLGKPIETQVTIEKIIHELRRRNYSVGLIKDNSQTAYKRTAESNSPKDKAQIISFVDDHKTDISYAKRVSINELLRIYDQDFVILDGIKDYNVPRIIAASKQEDIPDFWDERTFAISDTIDKSLSESEDLPVFNIQNNISELVDLVEDMVFEPLPDFPTQCCGVCGSSCQKLCADILKGHAKRSDCPLEQNKVTLKINEKEIPMVPFVQRILQNAVIGVVSELDGYRFNGQIEICIKE